MSNLPTWAAWVIVAACPLLGPVIAFLVVLPIAALDRWISGAKGASGLVTVAAGEISVRRRLAWRAPRPAPELVQSEPPVAAALGLSPSRQF
jgi:hypothetical protein